MVIWGWWHVNLPSQVYPLPPRGAHAHLNSHGMYICFLSLIPWERLGWRRRHLSKSLQGRSHSYGRYPPWASFRSREMMLLDVFWNILRTPSYPYPLVRMPCLRLLIPDPLVRELVFRVVMIWNLPWPCFPKMACAQSTGINVAIIGI